MNPSRLLTMLTVPALAALLGACGGGDGAPVGNTPKPPSAGSYGWTLKAAGPTSGLSYGLSLIHPSDPATEYVVEIASDAVTDAREVSSGTVNASGLAVTAITPYALVYIVGGDVRRVPLQANGTAPKGQVLRTMSSSACRFVIDAIDHAAPDRSRFIVSTAGADGACGTADDGRAEVRLDAGAAGLVFTPLAGAPALSALRDAVTLAPRGWVYPTEVALWAPGPGNSFAIRPGSAPLTRVVGSTYRSVLAESAAGLSLFDFSAGSVFTDTLVSPPVPTAWQPIGHDSQYHYLYRNSADSSGNWQVLRVSRSTAAADTLAAGNGEISLAALGKDQIYLTVFTSTRNQLLRLAKATPGAAVQVVEDTAPTTLSTVITSAGDVHQLWRVSGIGSTAPGYALEMIDESGAKLFATTAGGFPLLLAGGAAINLNASESRTRFVFVDRYGARAFGDASLMTYDASTRTATSIGTLPGSADFGSDFVFANVSGGSLAFMTGFAARSVNGVVQAAGTQLLSFDAGTASSLKRTSQQQ